MKNPYKLRSRTGTNSITTSGTVINILGLSFMILAGSNHAAVGSEFDGLYYPQGSKAPSSCSRISQELHPEGMIIDDGFIYSEDLVCELTGKRDRNGAYEFIGKCEAEGDVYRQIITIADFKSGIALTSHGRTTNWSTCR